MRKSTSHPLEWTLSGLLDHLKFVHRNMPDHAYAWVLGAGASRASGIPLGGELVRRWLNELHLRLDSTDTSLADWATAETLDIPKFDYGQASSFYSRIYERRFRDNPDEGFAYLEALMTSKDPSPGYSILAQALDQTAHKVVISTNFDNLVADALSIYTETFPLVIGHESLANFVRIVSRRPVICKIHRDLLLGPKNDHRSLRRLHESWAAALRALFSQYTPLFIGYGGNDDSLMDLLESLDPADIKGQLVWCYHERFAPTERIVDLVRQHAGALVPVPDFDLLMVLIGDQMGIEPIDDRIEVRAAKRARQYRDRLIKLDTASYPDVRRILRGAFERAGGTLVWHEKVRAEPSTARREGIYKQALEHYPDDLQLQMSFAHFLSDHCRNDTYLRELLTRLQLSDAELTFGPSCCLARLDAREGNVDEAKQILAAVPQSSATYFKLAVSFDLQGDKVTAEDMYRLASDEHPFVALRLAEFLVAQNRMDECNDILSKVQTDNEDASAVTVQALAVQALTAWAREDLATARAFANAVANAGSTNAWDMLIVARVALVTEDLDLCARAIPALETLPKANWPTEVYSAFVVLVYRLLADGEWEPQIERLHELLSLTYPKPSSIWRSLVKLAESVAPRLPKTHRKFIIALAEAIYDPDSRNKLSVYPQWRAGASPT